MDVKTVFLNGGLDEKIYVEQPECFVHGGSEQKVCKLLKSICGLKQSSRQWCLKFHEAVTSFDFVIEEDHCVYIKRFGGNIVTLSPYVDDILLAGTRLQVVKTIKDWLSLNFLMKYMGEAEYLEC